jgi:hypothetical protein
VTIFSKVLSDRVSATISFYELFSIAVEAEGGGNAAAASFEPSSSLRKKILGFNKRRIK